MSKKGLLAAAAVTGAAVGVGFGPLKETLKKRLREEAGKREWQEKGDRAVQKLFGFLADRVSDKAIGEFHRPDYSDFLEGSGYFLAAPRENAGEVFVNYL